MSTEYETTYHYPCPECGHILKSVAARFDHDTNELVLMMEPHFGAQHELRVDRDRL